MSSRKGVSFTGGLVEKQGGGVIVLDRMRRDRLDCRA
jgi:hypothetical protein